MAKLTMEVRVMVVAFLWLCVSESGWATKREDLERAAELAVERAAERAAERAVEKALESGNSTTETETIRESYSSVRKSDKTIQLPGTGYTPAQRHEYDRIMQEREAGERAAAFVKRSVDNIRANSSQLLEGNSNQRSQNNYKQQQKQQQQQQQPQNSKNLPEVAATSSEPFDVTRQLPFPVSGYESSDATVAKDEQRQQQQQQRLPAGRVYDVRDGDQFPSLYPVKVFAIKAVKPYPLQLFHVLPVTVSSVPIPTSTSPVTYQHSNDNRPTRFANTGDYAVVNDYGRRPGQGWIDR